jgi:hypothetical protein
MSISFATNTINNKTVDIPTDKILQALFNTYTFEQLRFLVLGKREHDYSSWNHDGWTVHNNGGEAFERDDRLNKWNQEYMWSANDWEKKSVIWQGDNVSQRWSVHDNISEKRTIITML